jgi:MoaA/NifB/PqqE/SkfB family radical SAM enzyme
MIFSSPHNINWNFTDVCGFDCRHCYSRGRPQQEELSLSQLLDICQKIVDANVFAVNFGGGEPLVHKHFIEAVKSLSMNGVQTFVTTSGWHLDENMVKKLKNAGISNIYISFDGSDAKSHDYVRRKPGTFDKAIHAANLCHQYNIKFRISTVITALNYVYIDDIVTLANKLGADEINLKRFRPIGNGEKNQSEFIIPSSDEREMLKIVENARNTSNIPITFLYHDFPIPGISDGCPCGKTSLGMMPNGDIKVCVYGDSISGNILTDNLSEIWSSGPDFISKRDPKTSCCSAGTSDTETDNPDKQLYYSLG